MKNKILLTAIIFLQAILIYTTYQTDRMYEQEVIAYRDRLAAVETRYLAEKANHNNTKLDLALMKRISEDKDEQLKAVQHGVYAGEFTITYFTAGPESTGKTAEHPEYGMTRSGTTVAEGRTIAADWDILPAGTQVWIEGIGIRTVEDTGSLIKGNSIDIYVESVEVAKTNGRHAAKVYVIGDKNQELEVRYGD